MKFCGISQDLSTLDIFFIKDILHRGNTNVKHCRTKDIIADFLTKPQQGSLFRRIRSNIMGHTPFPTEERVGKNILTVKQLTNRHENK